VLNEFRDRNEAIEVMLINYFALLCELMRCYVNLLRFFSLLCTASSSLFPARGNQKGSMHYACGLDLNARVIPFLQWLAPRIMGT